MERSKYLFFLIFIIAISSLNICAQVSYKREIYNALVNDDFDAWRNVLERMESLNPDSKEEKLELLNYYYGYIGYLIRIKDSKYAKNFIGKGEKLINELLVDAPDCPTVLSYKGAFTGFKLQLNKFKSISLGPESMKCINQALGIDSLNIQALSDKANMLYFSPSIFGGNKEQALLFYEKGIEEMEKQDDISNNWFYLYSITNLGQIYESEKQYEKAEEQYEKILSIEPDFKMVRDKLYPDLLKNNKRFSKK